LLNRRIRDAFSEIHDRLRGAGQARELVAPVVGTDGFALGPAVLEIDAADVTPDVTEEAFGPLVVLVRYRDLDQVQTALAAIPDSLTATLHAEGDEIASLTPLIDAVRDLSGRLIFNGYPTGVRVSWAQHHGGPWPATNTLHTSVGMSAIRRFLRPFAWQNAPEQALPPELRDDEQSIPRRVDGVLQLARTLTG
jgi:NADP-dependent aldehyde dehydrogenase